jgi:hypothetical protein
LSGSPASAPLFHAGQKVRLQGREEAFIVLRVDRKRHLADLLREGSVRKVETGIPLALLRPPEEPEAVGEFEMSA